MKIEELRVNNHIHSIFNNKDIVLDKEAFAHLIVSANKIPGFLDNFTGIELTEDHLKKWFEKDEDIEYVSEIRGASVSFKLYNAKVPFERIEMIDGEWVFTNSEGWHYKAPKYLHKMQNWWYESTDEELTLK